MLPNPMYGSWERAITGGTGTPCEQVQKKVEALRDR
jgi:predicted secreted acid phosphatase